jgi:lipopolysaccharide/colanic/teichoic acid biosynthesis glycosyltransferase
MNNLYPNYIKPVMDFVLALIGLIILSPIIITIIFILSLTNLGNPFFVQSRPGINGKTFLIIKFKTMNEKRDKQGDLLPDKVRLTKVGRILRRLSLDELPQLINVIKGDLSLVGPRPLMMRYLPLYNKEQSRRHEVKPGITGWAQVNGRNTISFEEKFEKDIYYVDHLSFGLDLKILYLTFTTGLRRKEVNSTNLEKMEYFEGTKR